MFVSVLNVHLYCGFDKFDFRMKFYLKSQFFHVEMKLWRNTETSYL